MFCVFNRSKLQTNDRKMWKFPNIRKINSILLSNPWVKKEVSKKTRKYFQFKMRTQQWFGKVWGQGLTTRSSTREF